MNMKIKPFVCNDFVLLTPAGDVVLVHKHHDRSWSVGEPFEKYWIDNGLNWDEYDESTFEFWEQNKTGDIALPRLATLAIAEYIYEIGFMAGEDGVVDYYDLGAGDYR